MAEAKQKELRCFDPEVGDIIVFRNVYNYLPVDTAQHFSVPESSEAPL